MTTSRRLTTSQEIAADQVSRAKAASLAVTVETVGAAELSIWASCLWCGHSQLFDMTWLMAQAKVRTAALEEVERRLKCKKCERHGVRLIRTPRTIVSFDNFGGY